MFSRFPWDVRKCPLIGDEILGVNESLERDASGAEYSVEGVVKTVAVGFLGTEYSVGGDVGVGFLGGEYSVGGRVGVGFLGTEYIVGGNVGVGIVGAE